MANFTFEPTKLPGLFVVNPFLAQDRRGYFLKSYEKRIFGENGIETDIFEDFESFSVKGVIRGLHFQYGNAQSKLVRALTGEIFDVVVDIRPDSVTFGQWCSVTLSGENHKAFFVPKGFAHGFMVLSENAIVSYKCSGAFNPQGDSGIRWDDADIGIAWPLEEIGGRDHVIMSDKDLALQSFAAYRHTIDKNQ
jgi:dTDP-4-dehydrorhamnose 3,5-epimerase